VYPLTGTNTASVEYTVFPNFTTSEKKSNLIIGGKPVTITQAANTATRDQRFIQLVYFNFLGRLPSPTELASQVPQVQSTSYTDFVMSFYNTPEFNLGGRFIAGLYRGLLGRDAEYSGWLFQRNALATGVLDSQGKPMSQEALVQNFIGGAEFDAKFLEQYPNANGGDIQASASDFIRYLYVNILGRTPSATEVNGHLPSLLAGGKVAKAKDFLNSAEFRNRTEARLTAVLLYATLLGRDGSQTDLAFREGQLKAVPPVPVQTLVDAFVKSSEFNGLIQ
jgi:hypothetical protein